MRTVSQVSKLTGVSVRTLHHYDDIGLLKPTAVTESGYRLYDDRALDRLQSILLFRELKFSLKEIKLILDHPDFDPYKAISRQIELLEMQYDHIGELISFAREIEKKGELTMDFDVFKNERYEQYKAEVKEKWGDTDAYREYEQRGAHTDNSDGLMSIFAEMGKLKDLPADHPSVQAKVVELKNYITDHYYTCTDEILLGLGEMYVNDGRFMSNIDRAGGEGTAQFTSRAISVYCKK